jgi:hypothetical protein
MGNWHLSVQGVGAHHNADHPSDADRMFARFVGDLKAAGHSVTVASMTYGSAQMEVGGQSFAGPLTSVEPSVTTTVNLGSSMDPPLHLATDAGAGAATDDAGGEQVPKL